MKGNEAQAVTRSNRETQQRRHHLAAEFRARLTAELPPGGSVMREALIDVATSAYVETTELTARFARCRATEAEMTRLNLARGQLSRVLRLLGSDGLGVNFDDSDHPDAENDSNGPVSPSVGKPDALSEIIRDLEET